MTNPKQQVEPEMLTVAVIAAKLSVSERKIRYAIADGAIDIKRFGDAIRVSVREYERILREGLPERKAA